MRDATNLRHPSRNSDTQHDQQDLQHESVRDADSPEDPPPQKGCRATAVGLSGGEGEEDVCEGEPEEVDGKTGEGESVESGLDKR